MKQVTTIPAPSQTEGGRVLALRLGFIALAGVGLFALYQVIWMMVSVGVGLAILGGLGVGAIAAFQALPLLGQRWENYLLKSRKREAKENPIEQAQNEYLRRTAKYQSFKSALENIGGMVASYKSKLDKTRRDKPNYDLRQEAEAYDKMRLFYENRKDRLASAATALANFKEKLDEASTKWEFQLEANQAIRAMNATDKEARINEILTEVAFDSVQKEFDTVFARLDVDAAEISASKQLEFGGGVTLDLSAVSVTQQLEPIAR